MSRHRNRRSHRLPFRFHLAEALEPRTLLALGPASLVKDINTLTESSEPAGFLELNGRTLFRADDGVHGAEWFSTDGTEAGTGLLRDFIPEWSETRPDLLTGTTPVVLGGTMLFRALDPSTGYELWKTDGTPAGTTLVKDINPGPNSSLPQYLTVAGDVAYFTATDGVHGYELWKTDGTDAGTQIVADLSMQTAQWDFPIALGALGDRLVFAGPGPEKDVYGLTYEPWVTDGTAAGTTMLRNINSAGSSMPGLAGQQGPVDVAVSNGMLYFAATSGGASARRELWKTDGTPAGTVLVADPTPFSSTAPRNLVDVGGTVYFTGGDTPSGPITTSTRPVYRTDPAAGVVELGKLGLRPDAIMGNVGGVFYILGMANSKVSLFKNDPAAPALGLVKELGPASEMTTWSGRIVDDDGAALFLAQAVGGEIGVRLWRSDGTAEGTSELARFDVGPDPNGVRFAPADPDAWILRRGGGGLFYFAGVDPAGGFEPWRTDGTAAGTYRLLDLNRDTGDSAYGDDRQVVWVDGPAGGRGLFVAMRPDVGEELWSTDGTEQGTTLLKDIKPGAASGIISILGEFSPVLNGRVYFRADSGGTGLEPWTSDGTPEGTYSLGDLVPGIGEVRPTGFTPFRGKMYFRPDSGVGGIWVTDGTPAGTRIAIPLETGDFVYRMFVAGDWMYYWVRRANGESQLWRSDATDAGNTLVKVISTAGYPFGGVKYSNIYEMDGVVYFKVDDTTSKSSLWRSDGTTSGTTLIKSFSNVVGPIVKAGSQLLMIVGSGTTSTLWLSDGTPAGTVPAAQSVPQFGAVPIQNWRGIVNVGNVAFLLATATDKATELWRTDGTDAGTQQVQRFSHDGGTRPRFAGVADGQVYFVILSPDYYLNWELWRSDGSASGTVMVQQFVGVGPHLQGGSTHTSSGGGRVYFNAYDGVHGWEMWSMPLQATTVAGRHVFYNNSAFDGHDPAATAADLSAIATDKAALRPGEAATFANVTSYDKGINGVLIDLAGAIDSALTADDFEFRVGRSGDPAGWAAAPAPVSVVSVPSPVGAAVGRYAITWADGAIHDTWLRVTVRSNERTGLASPDVFYFGNLVGEIGDELTDGSLRVTVRDMLAMRRRANLPAVVTSATDINRDGTFNAADLAIVRRNLLHSLPLLSTPVPVAPAVAQRPSPPRTSAARRGVLEVLR